MYNGVTFSLDTLRPQKVSKKGGKVKKGANYPVYGIFTKNYRKLRNSTKLLAYFIN